MTEFEEVLETILEEYARRDTEGDFDTWEETDSFVKEKAEVLLAYANLKEEPVSEELEEAADKYESEQQEKYKDRDNHDFDNYRDGFVDGLTHTYDAFKAGAKWQKTKDESVTKDLEEYINELSKQFPEVSFAKLSRIAVRVAKWKEEQMMAKAIDGKVLANGMGNPILHLWDKGRHLIDKKVKVIVIKED